MYLTFETTNELQQYVQDKIWRASIKSGIDTLMNNEYILKINDIKVGTLKFQIHKEYHTRKRNVTLTAFHTTELKKLDVLEDNDIVIEHISQFKEVKDLEITQDYLTFIYRDKYRVKKYPRKYMTTPYDMEIIDLDTKKSIRIISRHFSEILNLVEKSIKELSH